MYIYVLKSSLGSSKPITYVAERPAEEEFGSYIEFEISDIAELEGKTIIEIDKNSYNIVPRPPKDYIWNGTTWVKDEEAAAFTLAETKKAAIELINKEAAKAYNLKDRFAQEYLIRETEAIAYKESGYTGDVPRQVAAYATPVGLEPQVATDRIIEQAAQLREAVNKIGELRMLAYELQPLTTEFDVNERAAQIVLQIRAIGEAL